MNTIIWFMYVQHFEHFFLSRRIHRMRNRTVPSRGNEVVELVDALDAWFSAFLKLSAECNRSPNTKTVSKQSL